MTRDEVRAILEQAAAALSASPAAPATWNEETERMLREIHAAVVAKSASPAPAPAELPFFRSIPGVAPAAPAESAAPAEPAAKKPSWWKRLGSGLKTTLVAIGAGGGGAALSAAVEAVKGGNMSPTGIATAAIGAAVAGAIGYRTQSPEQETAK